MTADRTCDLFGDDRAVRNILGYVLTFAVVVTSVGVVSTTGYQQLEDLRGAEQFNNAERSLRLAAADFDDLQQGRARVRSSSIDLAGGSLAVTDTELDVEAVGTSFDRTLQVGALRYGLDRSQVVYESGALFRSDGDTEPTVVAAPPMVCSDQQALVSVVTLRAVDAEQVGSGRVQIVGSVDRRELRFPINRTGPDSVGDTSAVEVTVDSPRADGWNRAFTESGGWSETATDDQYRCDGVDGVYVRQTVINVSLRT
jgi:hypothetical protein